MFGVVVDLVFGDYLLGLLDFVCSWTLVLLILGLRHGWGLQFWLVCGLVLYLLLLLVLSGCFACV